MTQGRPPAGIDVHVRRLEASEEAKERLVTVLQVLTGELTVEEACERLGISESRLHDLRRVALSGAAAALTPGAAGRPRKQESVSNDRERELLAEIKDLEADLQSALLRTELARAMPKVLKPWKGKGSKKNG